MPPVDWEQVTHGKDAYRERVRSRPFAEKLQALERLRARDAQLGRLRARKNLSPGAMATFIVARQDQVAASSGGGSRFFTLGADVGFVSAVVSGGATGVGAAHLLPTTPDRGKP
jgi:hypothetical protein